MRNLTLSAVADGTLYAVLCREKDERTAEVLDVGMRLKAAQRYAENVRRVRRSATVSIRPITWSLDERNDREGND